MGGGFDSFRVDEVAGAKTSSPLVVLLGWYGCQDRYLRKYAELVGELGCASARATCPPWRVFAPTHPPRRAWAAALLRRLRAADAAHGAERRWVLYPFSNGGAFVAEQIDWLLAHDPEFKPLQGRIAGVVFDSAPAYMHRATGAAALGEGKPLPLRMVLTAMFFVLACVMSVLAPNRPAIFWRAMADLRLGQRYLYLYSHDDHLCDPGRLDDLVAARLRAGADVAARKWRVSRHVGHLRCHPREYRELLAGFLAGAGA